jgi:hypothetical protein
MDRAETKITNLIQEMKNAKPLIDALRERELDRRCVAARELMMELNSTIFQMNDWIIGPDTNAFWWNDPTHIRGLQQHHLTDPEYNFKESVRHEIANNCTCERCREWQSHV